MGVRKMQEIYWVAEEIQTPLEEHFYMELVG